MSILMGLDACQRRSLQLTTAFLLLLTAEAFSPPSTPTRLTSLSASIFNSEDDSTNELYQPPAEKTFVEEEVDIAIVGAGIGGLCAGAILNTLHGKKVGIYESHYLPGGCAHAFQRVAKVPSQKDKKKKEKVVFTYDSGPTIVLGCSAPPYNPLRQVLNAVGTDHLVNWIRYDGWGMIENPGKTGGVDTEETKRWRLELGPDVFESGPLSTFSNCPPEEAIEEFHELQKATQPLVSGAVEIPALAMRSGNLALVPLLRYFPALWGLIQQGELTTGTFGPFMDGPNFTVKNSWLRDWLDALAFSLSGLPAKRTAAAAMAYVLYDMHRPGAALDYPKGGLGSVINALVQGVEQGGHSKLHLRQHVEEILTTEDGTRAVGLQLRGGKKVIAKEGVICNAPVWLLNGLVKNDAARSILNSLLPTTNKRRNARQTWDPTSSSTSSYSSIRYDRPDFETEDDDASLLAKCDTSEQTGSFLHLHIALDATGLDLDSLEAHYTVMDRGLSGDQQLNRDNDGPCSESNMIAVSNPCVIDRSLAPEGYIVVHAYGAGNEPYHVWEGMDRKSTEYQSLKEERSQVLWRAVEAVIPDARSRVVHDIVGSPLTHERFLRRPRGTYGSATEDYLPDGATPIPNLVLCGDGIFPGIGVPSVALSGASAANALVNVWDQWKTLDELKAKELI